MLKIFNKLGLDINKEIRFSEISSFLYLWKGIWLRLDTNPACMDWNFVAYYQIRTELDKIVVSGKQIAT